MQYDSCSIWVLRWAFSWSGLVTKGCESVFSQRIKKMLYEWGKSTVTLNPPTTATVKVFWLLQWTFPLANCGKCSCVRILSGVNGNQQHIRTSSSLELKLWLSEHLSDHCEIASSCSRYPLLCFCPRLRPFSKPVLSQLELRLRVSLHMKSHSRGEGINKQTLFGQHSGSLSPHSMKSLQSLCATFKRCPPTPKDLHAAHWPENWS